MLVLFFLLLAVIGLIAGFLAGLLGIGGGIIVVPSLFFLMNAFFPSAEFTMQFAAANALASMVVTTFFSMFSHQKKTGIEWDLIKKMALGVFCGGLVGVYATSFFKSSFVERFFGIFLILNSLSFIITKRISTKDHAHYKAPNLVLSSCVGFFISSLSAILGIGGGVLSVQFFHKIHLNIKKCIATASAVSFFVSLFASVFYLALDKHHSLGSLNGLSFSLGPIYLPAFGLISLCSAATAPWGTHLVYQLETQIIKKIFGYVTLVIGIYMIIRTYI